MIYPSSVIGRSVGGFCAFAGVFILTLPIPIVVNVFSSCYKGRIWRIEMANKRKVKSAKLSILLWPQWRLPLFWIRGRLQGRLHLGPGVRQPGLLPSSREMRELCCLPSKWRWNVLCYRLRWPYHWDMVVQCSSTKKEREKVFGNSQCRDLRSSDKSPVTPKVSLQMSNKFPTQRI